MTTFSKLDFDFFLIFSSSFSSIIDIHHSINLKAHSVMISDVHMPWNDYHNKFRKYLVAHRYKMNGKK